MTKISARDLCAGCGLLVSIRTIQRHKHRILAGFTCGDRKGRKAALHYLPKLAGGVKDVREVNGWEHVARNGNNAEYAQAGRSSDEATVGEVVHPNEFEGDGEAQMLNHNNEDAYASGNCDGIRRAPCGNAGGDSNIHEDAHMHADSSNDIDIDIDAHANDDGLRLVLGRTTSSPELSIVDAYVFQTERRMLRDAGILPPLPAIFPSKGRDGDTPKAGDIILLGRSRRVTLVGRFITNPAALRGRHRRELQPENLGSFYFVVKALAENFSFDPTATNCEQVQRTADCFFCNATVCGFYG
eukprot:Opistho-2@35124